MLGLFALGFVTLIVSGCGATADTPAETTALAECLTTKGVIMYGTERCPHCKTQKALFWDAFSKINYVDCDKEKNVCSLAGVTGYPTWKFADGTALPGTQTLEMLSSTAGCDNNTPQVVVPLTEEIATGSEDSLSGEVIVTWDALTGIVITPSTGA